MLALAKRLSPVKVGNTDIASLVANGRVTTAADLVNIGQESGSHMDRGREPHLMICNILNPGFILIDVEDCNKEQDKNARCTVVINLGPALVSPDTAIYWE
jgi:hypothetical protein